MKRQIDPEVALEAASILQDWIPLSDSRALRWAVDLLEQRAGPEESIERAVERLREAAQLTARATRDVRYYDVYQAVCWSIKRDVETRVQEKQDLDRKAIPASTGGLRTGAIAIGIFTDIASKLLRADDYEQEFELRRRITDEEIRKRRDELQQKAEDERQAHRMPS